MGKTVVVIRHAGAGDAIQASCVLPYLKNDGYEITFYANDSVKDILRGNPYIDHWMHFEDDVIPIRELQAHYDDVCAKFDKGVILTGTIEQNLLFGFGQDEWDWKSDVRRAKVDNKNYYDAHIERAGYEGGEPNGELYFDRSERRRAMAWRNKLKKKGKVIIGWALSGSSVHKAYRYTENCIRAFAEIYPDSYFVFFGDYVTKLLTFPHPNTDDKFVVNEPSFRESLLYAQHCDIVIGPETGILMGAGCKDSIEKIVLMSHSAPDQICKYWKNTQAITPPCEECYPCHRLFKFSGLHLDVCELVTLKDDDEDVKIPKCCFTQPELVLDALERAYARIRS